MLRVFRVLSCDRHGSRCAEMWTSVSPWLKVLATLAETFIFIYMGVAMFLESQAWATMPFALVGIVGGARKTLIPICKPKPSTLNSRP